MGIHDSGYKQLFAFPAMVKDLLVGFVKEDWVQDLETKAFNVVCPPTP